MLAFVLVLLAIGCGPRPAVRSDGSPRFTDLQDGTVRDDETRLRWARDANLAAIDDPWGGLTWEEANAFVADMNAGTRPNMGCTTWRLPRASEMLGLLRAFADPRSLYGQQIAARNADSLEMVRTLSAPFVSFAETAYWSSTEGAEVAAGGGLESGQPVTPPAFAVAVDTSGTAFALPKSGRKRLWPVCGATAAAPERSCSSPARSSPSSCRSRTGRPRA
jgi:hypothetical protein